MAGLEGRRWDGGTHRIERADFQAYAAATGDTNPAYEGPDAVAPPMFHVRPMIGLLEGMAHDPELGLDVLRLVHGEHAMTFHRPLRHGDALALTGELTKLEDKPSGRVATFSVRGTVGGEAALEGSTVFFIRAKTKDEPKKPKEPAPEPPPPSWTASLPVARDQATRYAEASGDRNPIHLDDAVARQAGLPGVILHGLCTVALAARELVDRAADRDPRRLVSIAVRWARPVVPGQTLALKVWDAGGGAVQFVVENERGEAVVVNGRAALRSGPAR